MTNEQYASINRMLGILEGYGFGISQLATGADMSLYWDAIETIDGILEEIKPTS